MISVLMATYNGERYIEKQLISILKQTVMADKVIICDDCSTDSTVNIIRTFIELNKLDCWELIVNEKNLGHYQTFIKLSSLASSEILFFSDQDDIWFDNKIEIMSKAILEDDQISMVFCRSNYIDDNDQVFKIPKTSGDIHENPIHKQLTSWPSGYQTAIRNSMVKDIILNDYDSYIGFDYHDVLYGLTAPLYGKVKEIDIILDSHRIHSNNVTLSVNNKSFKASKLERREYIEKVANRFTSLEKISRSKNSIYSNLILEYRDFNKNRVSILTNFSLFKLFIIWKNKKYYASKKDFIADMIYAMNLSNIARKLVEIRE